MTLTFTWTENGEDENMDLVSTDWTKAQTLFQRLEQKDLSKIKFKTRELEENGVLREWSNVPSVLKSYVTSNEEGRIEMMDKGPEDDGLPDDRDAMQAEGKGLDESESLPP